MSLKFTVNSLGLKTISALTVILNHIKFPTFIHFWPSKWQFYMVQPNKK